MRSGVWEVSFKYELELTASFSDAERKRQIEIGKMSIFLRTSKQFMKVGAQAEIA